MSNQAWYRQEGDLLQTEKGPITNRKETYYRQKRDLSQTEKSPICPQKGPSIDKKETVQTKGNMLALKKTCSHSKRDLLQIVTDRQTDRKESKET